MYEVLNQDDRSTEEYDTLSNNPTDQYVCFYQCQVEF